MVANVEDVIKQVLALSDEDRALVLQRVIASLESDAPPEPGVEAAWQEEIARRLDEIRSGRAEMIPWETVRDELQKTLRDPR